MLLYFCNFWYFYIDCNCIWLLFINQLFLLERLQFFVYIMKHLWCCEILNCPLISYLSRPQKAHHIVVFSFIIVSMVFNLLVSIICLWYMWISLPFKPNKIDRHSRYLTSILTFHVTQVLLVLNLLRELGSTGKWAV